MNRITKRKSLILISVGLLVISFTQVLTHYIELPDLTKGLFTGIGMGMLVIALFPKTPKSTYN